jgi:uncharacterized protein (DUF58 family)
MGLTMRGTSILIQGLWFHPKCSLPWLVALHTLRQLRPSPRFLGSVFVGLVPLVLVSDSHLAWAWCLGWNVCVGALALTDVCFLSRKIEFQAFRDVVEQTQERAAIPIRYLITSSRNISVEMVDELSHSLELLEGGTDELCSLVAGEEMVFSYYVKARRRGNIKWGAINLIAEDRIGLFLRRVRIYPDGPSLLRVMPQLRNLDAAYLNPRLLLAELGLKLQRKRGEGSEFDRIREAQSGDSSHRIDWRATARAKKKMVRSYRPEQCDDIVLCIDHGRLMGVPIDGQVSKLDASIEAALYLATVALNVGDRVGFLAFSDQAGPWVMPKRGRKHLANLLAASYDLEAYFLPIL